jgi:protein-disulfide isomerase
VVPEPLDSDLSRVSNINPLTATSRSFCLAVCLVLTAQAAKAQYAKPRMQVAQGERTIMLDNFGVAKGNVSAPIWIVEMADFGCGYCAKFARETMPVLDSLYTDKGQVYWRFIPFVLGMFPNAREAAEGSVCAGRQGKFWPMHDRLYEHRKAWMASKDPKALVARLAAQAGVEPRAYAACAKSKSVTEEVARNTALARSLNVRGTPTFVINGEIVPGALPTDIFVKGLDAVLRSLAAGSK